MASVAHLHVDHVGSLLRPTELREARIRLLGTHDADRNLGPHRNAELALIEDKYIRDVVRLQEGAGLTVVTDGDYRRRSWWTDFLLGFSGLAISYTGKTPITLINAAGETRPIAGFKIDGPIRPRESTLAKSFEFLKSVTSRIAKATIPGPPIVHFLRDADFIPTVYRDIDAFWADLCRRIAPKSPSSPRPAASFFRSTSACCPICAIRGTARCRRRAATIRTS